MRREEESYRLHEWAQDRPATSDIAADMLAIRQQEGKLLVYIQCVRVHRSLSECVRALSLLDRDGEGCYDREGPQDQVSRSGLMLGKLRQKQIV